MGQLEHDEKKMIRYGWLSTISLCSILPVLLVGFTLSTSIESHTPIISSIFWGSLGALLFLFIYGRYAFCNHGGKIADSIKEKYKDGVMNDDCIKVKKKASSIIKRTIIIMLTSAIIFVIMLVVPHNPYYNNISWIVVIIPIVTCTLAFAHGQKGEILNHEEFCMKRLMNEQSSN